MLPNLTPDMDLAAELFDGLRAGSRDGEGVTREAYGPGERMAHALVRAAAAERIGLESSVDVAGDLYMTLPGSSTRREAHHHRQPSEFRGAGRLMPTARRGCCPASPRWRA